MKLSITTPKTLIQVFIAFIFCTNLSVSQEFSLNNQESQLTVYGTSSLHDWHITTENHSGKIVFSDISTGDIKNLELSIVTESLKSGKRSMDKNTYKALNTDEHKTITFKLNNVDEVNNKSNGKFSVKTTGYLTIAGTKKQIKINFDVNTTSSGKVILTGEKTIKMTDFNVDPPKALLGTITTGDEITIKFSTIFK